MEGYRIRDFHFKEGGTSREFTTFWETSERRWSYRLFVNRLQMRKINSEMCTDVGFYNDNTT